MEARITALLGSLLILGGCHRAAQPGPGSVEVVFSVLGEAVRATGTAGEAAVDSWTLLLYRDGRLAEAGALAIVRPEDGATFSLVPGGVRQRIVFQVAGNPEGAKLWWFMDGAPAGESVGLRPFAVDPVPGKHVVTCATAEGVSATTTIRVETESASSR